MSTPAVNVDTQQETRRSHVIPPAVQARRMQRYSVYLIAVAFLLVALNYRAVTFTTVLWIAAGLSVAFSLLCAACVVILHGLAWNFDRLREEMKGGRRGDLVGTPDPAAPPRPSSWHGVSDPTAS